METERTKNRRELREKRLAYFDKNSCPSKPTLDASRQRQASHETLQIKSSERQVKESPNCDDGRGCNERESTNHLHGRGCNERQPSNHLHTRGNCLQPISQPGLILPAWKDAQNDVRGKSKPGRTANKNQKVHSNSQQSVSQRSVLQTSRSCLDPHLASLSVQSSKEISTPGRNTSGGRSIDHVEELVTSQITNSSHKATYTSYDIATSSPRRDNFAIGDYYSSTGEGKSRSPYPKVADMGPGARPKVRPVPNATGSSNPRFARKKKNILRDTCNLGESTHVQGGNDAASDSAEGSQKYESFDSSRLEIGQSKVSFRCLEPVSVPAVIYSDHRQYRMGTKEQPLALGRKDEVDKIERRYDYPQSKDMGRSSYDEARKVAAEHNAFGVDSMLNEMRQVRRVKSQLHEELRESFDKFGSVSGILGSSRYYNDVYDDQDSAVRIRDEQEDGKDLDQLERDGEDMIRPLAEDEIENKNHSLVVKQSMLGKKVDQNGNELEVMNLVKERWSEEEREMDVAGTRLMNRGNNNDGCLKVSKAWTASHTEDIGADDQMLATHFESVKERREFDAEERTKGERRSPEDDNNGALHKQTGQDYPGDESRGEQDGEKDDFNLGALCEAAKRGDDILKDYIKRLTQKILNKREGVQDSSLLVQQGTTVADGPSDLENMFHYPKKCYDTELIEKGIEGPGYLQNSSLSNANDSSSNTRSATMQMGGSDANKYPPYRTKTQNGDPLCFHKDPEQLVSNSVDLKSEMLEQASLGRKTNIPIAVMCKERLDQLGPLRAKGIVQNDAEKGGEIQVGDSDLDRDEGGTNYQETWENEMGFETHRPIDRLYSPLNVVRFSGHPGFDRPKTYMPEGKVNYGTVDAMEGNVNVYLEGLENCDIQKDELTFRKKEYIDNNKSDESHKPSRFDAEIGCHTVNSEFLNGYKLDSDCMTGAEVSTKLTSGDHNLQSEETSWLQSRSPRTPEEHRRGVERHHQWGKRQEKVEDSPGELVTETENDIEPQDLRLNLSSIEQSEGRSKDAFITEMSSDWVLNEDMSDHEGSEFNDTVERNIQSRMDDDESLLMRKISDCNPSAHNDFNLTESGVTGGKIAGGVSMDSRFESNGCGKSAYHSEAVSTYSSRHFKLQERHSENERTHSKFTNKDSKGKKPQEVSVVTSKVKTGSTSQYKSRWPQSSNLIPTRPSGINPRHLSPARKVDKRLRPASAKVIRGSQGDTSQGQRSRPKSAISSSKKSKAPDASGDFFKVRSSTMFDGSVYKDSGTGPLTLKLISDSPREKQSLSIWQLLPDEILLSILSHLEHTDLLCCALVCHGFHRVAMDESLWKCINVDKKNLTDFHLTHIGLKHPSSIIFSHCQGESVTENGLRNLFRTCVDSLRELHVIGCTGEMFSGDWILLHASRCSNLSSINASWCNVTDNGLNAVSGGANRLSSVCLNGCQGVSDTGLRSLVDNHGTSLVTFEVFGCIDLSPMTLVRIGDVCKNLRSLNIGQCYKVTYESIFEVMPKLKSLRHLDVRGCKQIRDDCVQRIAKCCKRLETLVIANCAFISNSAMIDIAANLKTIRSLDVSGCKKISNDGVRSVAMCCSKLEALNLSSTSIDRKSISTLASYCSQNLSELKLNCCKDITEASIVKLLKHCRRMETLHLYGVKGLRNLGLLKLQYPCLMYE